MKSKRVAPQVMLERVRRLCLSFPETSEKEAWGMPTFRVAGRMFAMFPVAASSLCVWCNATPDVQEDLMATDPKLFFKPPYVGVKGWLGINLERSSWQVVAGLLEDSFRLTAPKKLLRTLKSTKEVG
jgi:hypothetical protein